MHYDNSTSLEKEMATHSSILAWKILWTEEPGGLQSVELQRVGRDWAHTCGILVPQPGSELTPTALEGEVSTTGLPAKSLDSLLIQKDSKQCFLGISLERIVRVSSLADSWEWSWLLKSCSRCLAVSQWLVCWTAPAFLGLRVGLLLIFMSVFSQGQGSLPPSPFWQRASPVSGKGISLRWKLPSSTAVLGKMWALFRMEWMTVCLVYSQSQR